MQQIFVREHSVIFVAKMKYIHIGYYIFQMPFVKTYISSDNEETITSNPDPFDELHMDSVPTGYLPDSVYRELAWYGILQIQPLYRSTKHKVAARWIWQNTLGRPHVIVENQPEATQSEYASGHQTILEESVKWSREQRMAQDVLMENVRNGGNGLTVRTVISATKKTVYIIQNGKYFSCEEGSEPDVEAFRVQTNIHERQCTFGKPAVPLLLQADPCIEAETVPLEYSVIYEWMFCFGDGERDTIYSSDGDLDCGEKKKMSFTEFLRECAIDNNVVITYEYFGDEPRKDMVHNTTLCTSWDPCRISYLYRVEIPENKPEVPTTTEDPCATTICPECVEGVSVENSYPVEGAKSIVPRSIDWLSANSTSASTLTNCAVVAGTEGWDDSPLWVIRTHYGDELLPGKLAIKHNAALIPYQDKEITVHNFEVLCAPEHSVRWMPASMGDVPANAILAGITHSAEPLYVCRVPHHKSVTPGKVQASHGYCYISFGGKVIASKSYEVLCEIVG